MRDVTVGVFFLVPIHGEGITKKNPTRWKNKVFTFVCSWSRLSNIFSPNNIFSDRYPLTKKEHNTKHNHTTHTPTNKMSRANPTQAAFISLHGQSTSVAPKSWRCRSQVCAGSKPPGLCLPVSILLLLTSNFTSKIERGLGLILGGSLFYARVTFKTLVVFNFKVP